MEILSGLNDEQKKAVQSTSGPLLILAGAGSGKTKTLTHRIAFLIVNEKIRQEQVLAVTFTNKAAKEMRTRLGHLLSGNSNHREFMPWMGTFHSICLRLLRIDGSHIGLNRNFVIYDEDDKQSLIKQAMKQLSIDSKQYKPQSISSAISSAKNEMVSPDDFDATAYHPNQKITAKVYRAYESSRKKAGALDFDDLLLEVVKLLKERREVRNKWRDNFKHILIDEYQDTNALQYTIVKLLVSKDRNICVVGDDWQSIYSWRGADFTNILNFEKDFEGALVIKLEQNYRSTSSILDAANSVISYNKQRTDKKLWTDVGSGQPVTVHPSYDEAEEAYLVAERIYSHAQMKARSYDDFAVLYRMNAQSYTLERAMLQLKVPYKIVGGVRFYDRKEIKDILAYLKLLYQPNDRVSFTRIANVPTRGIGDTSLIKFLQWQSDSSQNIVEALRNAHVADGLQPRAKSALGSLGDLLSKIQVQLDTLRPHEIIEMILTSTNYKSYINDGTTQAEEREANLGALISDAKSFVLLEDFLEEVSLMSSSDLSTEGGKVTLMTLHAAKGLEFPVVFIVGLEEGILPHARVQQSLDESDLEEERRLMYVGMTRAREELHVCYANSRLQFGNRSYNPVSRFIDEMGLSGSSYMGQVAAQKSFNTDNNEDYYTDMPFEIGDKVKSPAFGQGEVCDIDGLALTVRFNNGQAKTLNVEFARLTKI